jgi:nicotinate phosphoribosyltransferase
VALPNGEIDIQIHGPWLHTILFEIPVLAIVNEVYFRNTQPVPDYVEGRQRVDTKIAQLQEADLGDLKIADYGTRRRFSKPWHEEVLRVLTSRLGTGANGRFAGTSNALFARTLGLTPLGTMAHEYLQACQALGISCQGQRCQAQRARGDSKALRCSQSCCSEEALGGSKGFAKQLIVLNI